MKREKLILIDGSSYFFRAFYAIQRLSTSKGFPTNAIFGFINMLMRVLEVEKPTKLGIAFDAGKATFRKERYPEYKANREKPPDDLVVQIPHIIRSVDCFGIPRFEQPGFEADDIIGTIARRAEAEGFHVEIITGDKDLMQLVTPHITIFDTMKDKRIDEAGVIERFGVRADQVVDLLALMGDSSDNIPGVSGIGEKTAAELIQKFGSLEQIYEKLDEIKQPKRRETLLKEKDMAFLSRELATIKCDMEIEYAWSDFDYKGPVAEKMQPFLQEFEFAALMKKFDLKPKEENYVKGQYETVLTEARLKEVVKELGACPYLALDTETTSLNAHSADLVGLSLSGKEGVAYYIPVGHWEPGSQGVLHGGQLAQGTVRALVKPLLENPKIGKVGQNLKYDIQVLKRWGVEVQGIFSDTLIASYLIDPSSKHNLDALALRYLGHQNITYEEVTGKGRSQTSFAEVSFERATEYSGEDVDVTLRIHHKLLPEIEKNKLKPLYQEVELPLLQVLSDMEYEGVTVDVDALDKMSKELEEELVHVQDQIFKLAGEPVNINSPKQLSALLFEKLKLPVIRKTKTGYSTDESVLEELCGHHEICKWILKHREFMKLKSTYVDGLLVQVHPATGKIHTHFNQTVAATGRLSSSDPNLQNIPADTDERFDIRSVFIAEKGKSLLSADYSQVELRLLADMSEDKALLKAFQGDEDVHESTARAMFGAEKVSPEQRKIAKTINFGVIYGQTPFGLSRQLGITPKEAKQFIETYFEKYTGVKTFLSGLAEDARQRGYAVTRLGRRRFLPDLQSKNRMIREMAERAAINMPLQGTAADMIKVAMVHLHERLEKEKLSSRMILQVHDELVLEVPDAEKNKAETLVRETMESALALKIPLKVDVGWGSNWSECN